MIRKTVLSNFERVEQKFYLPGGIHESEEGGIKYVQQYSITPRKYKLN